MKRQLLLLSIFFAFVLNSCNPDDNRHYQSTEPVTDSEFLENFGSTVSRDFLGQVVNTNNEGIQGVSVKIGASTATTDANGIFMINGASVREKFAYITATKAGYLSGSRSLAPTSGKNQVRIMLLEGGTLEIVQSEQVSEVSIYSGTKVKFDGAFETESGSAYSGDVQVNMFHLNPSNPDISSLMPGSLLARGESGNPVGLITFGMIRVELTGSSGQKLQIAEGHTAEITMRIDDDQLATAPSEIPLWHFDEEAGFWKLEGSATKVGNYYVGNVGHFSWWNCDTFEEIIYLRLQFVDSENTPISIRAKLSTSSGFNSYARNSDGNGEIAGYVLANDVLTLTTTEFWCGESYTQSIGPFAEDAILPVVVNFEGLQTREITGNFLTCDGTPVVNGVVIVETSQQEELIWVSDGVFSFTTMMCASVQQLFELTAIDYDNLQTSDEITFTVQSPETNLGNIISCNNIDSFITYQIDQDPVVTLTSNIILSVPEQTATIGVVDSPNILDGLFIGGITGTGTFTTNDSFWFYGPSLNIQNGISNDLQFVVSRYEIQGSNKRIDLTVNGTYTDETGTHSLSVTAHVVSD